MIPIVETPAPEPVLSDNSLLALLVVDGVLLGALGLLFTPLYTGSVPVPMGAVLSILILPWLVLRAGEVDARATLAGAPLTAWAATVLVLGLFGPGGDVLLPTTWQSLLLVAGGIGAGLLALRHVMVGQVVDRGTRG